jgi:hypothetical protein
VRIPDWRREISGKTSCWEKVYQRLFKDLGRVPGCGWELLYLGKLIPVKKYTN